MVTLANINGASLVSLPSNRVLLETFGTKQSRDKEAALKRQQEELLTAQQREIGILTGAEPQETDAGGGESGFFEGIGNAATAALEQISKLSPDIAAGLSEVLGRGDPEELAQISASVSEGKDKADRLLGLGSHAEKLNALREDLQKGIADGSATEEDTARVIALSNMSEDQLSLELQKMQVIGNAVDTAIPKPEGLFSTPAKRASFTRLSALNPKLAEQLRKNEVTRRAGAPDAPEAFTLSEGQTRFGPQGRVIATGKPKRPTKTSLIKNLEAIGIDPLSAEGKDIVKKSLTKPGVKINLSEGLDFKIPNGFMLLDKNNPSSGVTPIPGGPQDEVAVADAAKITMLDTAQKAFPGVREAVFDKDGSLDRTNLFNADFNTPFSDGRKLRNQMEFGIQAITRLETGAAMPPEEVNNTRARFMPQVGDTVDIANIKLDMYEQFIGGTLKLIDPSGRFLEDRFNTELEARTVGEDAGASSLSDDDLLRELGL